MHSSEGLIGLTDMATYLRCFSTLINAGVNLMRSLSVLDDTITYAQLKEANLQLRHDIAEGATLSQAMRKHPTLFSGFLIAMVRAGEIGGVLDETLERAADFYQRQMEYRRQRHTMLATAQVLGKEHEDNYVATVRALEDRLVIQYFLYMLGTMLGAGVPILMALGEAASIIEELRADDEVRQRLSEGMRQARADINEERPLSPALAAAGFPAGVMQLLEIGEETGTLDRTALRAGDLLGAEIDGRMQEALGLNDF